MDIDTYTGGDRGGRGKKKAVLDGSWTRARTAIAQRGYAEVNERVKKSIKSEKMAYIETLAAEARRRLNILT